LKEWRLIAEGSIEGSWCGDARKKALLRRVEEWAQIYKDVA
jgi:hypothetical protein